jgi:hypothetical protein
MSDKTNILQQRYRAQEEADAKLGTATVPTSLLVKAVDYLDEELGSLRGEDPEYVNDLTDVVDRLRWYIDGCPTRYLKTQHGERIGGDFYVSDVCLGEVCVCRH